MKRMNQSISERRLPISKQLHRLPCKFMHSGDRPPAWSWWRKYHPANSYTEIPETSQSKLKQRIWDTECLRKHLDSLDLFVLKKQGQLLTVCPPPPHPFWPRDLPHLKVIWSRPKHLTAAPCSLYPLGQSHSPYAVTMTLADLSPPPCQKSAVASWFESKLKKTVKYNTTETTLKEFILTIHFHIQSKGKQVLHVAV